MRKIMLMIAMMATMTATAVAENPYARHFEGLPFEMPVLEAPQFLCNSVSIVDYGAKSDGETLCTEAFAQAIDALSAMGGGTLEVPAGVWLTGPITLRSNINMHLDGGALILFSPNPDDYPVIYTVYEGYESYRAISPIYGVGLENVAITGNGVIDGNGGAWRQVKRDKLTESQWKALLASGGVTKEDRIWYPGEDYLLGEQMNAAGKVFTAEEAARVKRFLRPVMVKLVECKNVLLQGVLFQNSPAWNLHPLMCENLIIDNVYIKNPDYAQNGDGLDVESCTNVLLVGSTLDVGDDAICLKSGKDEAGRKRGIPTQNVVVRDCRVFHGHGGFVVGSEMSGGVKNVSVKGCQFIGTDVGLRFKSTRGRGGVVENIHISDVHMLNIKNEALLFDLYYFVKNPPAVAPAVDETTPEFRDIFISNVSAFGSGTCIKFNGIPEMPIRNIRVSNSVFTGRNAGLLSESTDIRFDNVGITAATGAALHVNNVSDCIFTDCLLTAPSPITYTGTNSSVSIP